ncbi:exonuclease RecJ [halophilic archaeon]|nr:exonuclease RecJ [halophilic archaeon]
MSTAGRTTPEDDPAASEVAAALREADFVRLLARADGEALAATGLLARACSDAGIPFQASASQFPEARSATSDDDDGSTDELVVTVGAAGGDLALADAPTVTAHDAAAELDASPDPVLALAGVVAAGRTPGTGDDAHLLDAAEARLARRPGVAVPTNDLADGLAHSTLLHAGFSGDSGAVQADLAELDLPAELDGEAHREVASLVALAVAGSESATPRAAEAVERALRPYELADAPFATLGGYADVLDAVARERPGTAVALALGHDARTSALDAWRDHADAAHASLREATTGRYDGLFVARTDDAPVETAARLLRDFRSPEPTALVVTSGEAAAVAAPTDDERDLGATMREAASAVGGDGTGTARRGYARFDAAAKEFLTAFREAL